MPHRGFWSRVREARLIRVLVLYLAASWLVLQITALLQNQLQLPQWVTALAVILLLIGLMVVLATAWVQSHPVAKARERELPSAWEIDVKGLLRSLAARRPPHLTWARAMLGGLVAFSLLFGAAGVYVLLRERGATVSVVREASAAPGPGLAVLPFEAVGPELELWREGMVHLLYTNLDGAAGLRTINPRTVLSKWRAEIGEGKEAPRPEAALRVARDVGATYALTGSAVALGGGVRLSAEVYDAQTGRLLGRAQVEGSPDSVFALLNRLSVDILRAGLVREAADVPPVDLSRVTTSSLPALKAFLEGEQKFRRSRFREAIADFTRAVEADSTFALALYRISVAYGWTEAFSPRTLEYAHRAGRFADRLPERAALLVRADPQQNEFRLGAIQLLEELTNRYPDDVEGWYALGEAYWHVGDKAPYPRERSRNAFLRALELDPAFSPAYIHLFDDALVRQDSVEATELIARHREIDPASPHAIGLNLAYTLSWGDSASRQAARAALDTARADALFAAWARLAWSGSSFWKQSIEVSEAISQPRHPQNVRDFGYWGFVRVYAGRGQLQKAQEALEARAGAFGESAQDWRSYLMLHLAGRADPSAARRAAARLALDPEPWDRFLLGAFAASERRWMEAEKEIQALEAAAQEADARQDTIGAADRRAYAEALRGYLALQRGNREAALKALEEAAPKVPFVGIPEILRYELGRLLLDAGNPRAAERYLKSVEFYPHGFAAAWASTLAELHLGQVYEALGDVEQAKLHYARFVRWWEDCDPELRPWWEQGRQALARLTREATSR